MNKHLSIYLLFLVFVLLLATGCHRGQEPHYVRVYEKGELDELVKPGMTLSEITNVFGPPGIEMKGMEENELVATYLFSSEAIKSESGLHLIGFNVNIKDGRVMGWSPIASESINTFRPLDSSEKETLHGEETFDFFVETDRLTNILEYFDSKGSADVSNITSPPPNLELHAQVFAGSPSSTSSSILLLIGDQDVAKLRHLTENNIGKRMLIVCHNKVIAAPNIVMPLTSKSIQVSIKDRHLFDLLKK